MTYKGPRSSIAMLQELENPSEEFKKWYQYRFGYDFDSPMGKAFTQIVLSLYELEKQLSDEQIKVIKERIRLSGEEE